MVPVCSKCVVDLSACCLIQRFHGYDQAGLRLHEGRYKVHSVSVCSIQHQEHVQHHTWHDSTWHHRRLFPAPLPACLHASDVPLYHFLVSQIFSLHDVCVYAKVKVCATVGTRSDPRPSNTKRSFTQWREPVIWPAFLPSDPSCPLTRDLTRPLTQ